MPALRRLLAGALIVAGTVVAPAGAQAGAGGFTELPGPGACIKGLIGSNASKCTTLADGLSEPLSFVISPDGRFGYAASVEARATSGALIDGGQIVVVSRDTATGALTQLPAPNGCLRAAIAPVTAGCTQTARGIAGAETIALSPDGRNAYVTGLNADAIAAFSRDPVTGALTQLPGNGACIHGTQAADPNDCPVLGRGLHGPRYLTVSPDGKNVYVAVPPADEIAAFARDATTGALTQLPGNAACIQDTLAADTADCPVTARGLNYPRTLSVSPDGLNVYVASDTADSSWPGDPADGDAVSVFSRDPTTGALAQLPGAAACVKDVRAPATTQCTSTAKGLGGAFSVTVSPDGRNVYVASDREDDVATFTRDPSTGALSQPAAAPCIQDTHSNDPPPCPVTAPGLDGANGVTVSADGLNLYVASFYGNAFAAFARDQQTGALTSIGCGVDRNAGTTPKNASCPTTVIGTEGSRAVTISPDGGFAYIPASVGGTVAEFARDAPSCAVPCVPPTATTGAATSPGDHAITLGGTVNPQASPTTFQFEYGPTTAYGFLSPGGSAGSTGSATAVSEDLTGLMPGTAYHYRLVATNAAGTTRGSDGTFATTGFPPPTVSTGDPTAVGATAATLNATVNPQGASTSAYFEYSSDSSLSSSSPAQDAGSGTSDEPVGAPLTGLAPSTTYQYRVVATNGSGTVRGVVRTFTTNAPPSPAATTGAPAATNDTSATVGATVNPNGVPTTWWVEYGGDTSYGSQTPAQDAGSGSADVSGTATITGLFSGTSYHYRVVAKNSFGGVTRGADLTFTTTGRPSYVGRVLADGATSLWRLGELTGTVAADAGGLNPGTYVPTMRLGQAGAINGDSDTAVALDGSTGLVRVPDAPSLRVGDTFTLEAWVKRSKVDFTSQALFTQGTHLQVYFDGGNLLVLRKPNVGTVAASTAALTDTLRWHHVVVTKSGTSVHLYLDGNEVTGATNNQTLTDAPGAALSIGGGAGAWKGSLDEVALYGKALSATQVANHYAIATGSGPATPPAPVVTPQDATGVDQSNATLRATVNPGGSATTYHFDYGSDTHYGTSTPETPAGSGSADTPATAAVSGLAAGTVYHYRAVATNPTGTALGADRTLTTAGAPGGASYAATVAADGPAGWWRLGDLNGTSATDQLGKSPGVFSGAFKLAQAGAIAGDPDTAVVFDGSTAQLRVADTPSIRTGDTFSLEIWVKRSANTFATQGLFSKGANNYQTYLDGNGRIVLRKAGVSPLATSTGVITDTLKWHHVVITKAGPVVKLYLDGADVTGTVANLTMTAPASALVIGNGGAPFRGALDEAAVYTKALTSAQVLAHYRAGTGT